MKYRINGNPLQSVSERLDTVRDGFILARRLMKPGDVLTVYEDKHGWDVMEFHRDGSGIREALTGTTFWTCGRCNVTRYDHPEQHIPTKSPQKAKTL